MKYAYKLVLSITVFNTLHTTYLFQKAQMTTIHDYQV